MNDPLKVQDRVRRQVRRRRRWRRARIALLSITATVAVIAAAFGIDRLAVAAHRFYVEHHHTTRGVAAKKHVTTTTVTTVPGPAHCDSPQLSATVSDWRDTNGLVEEKVSLTNISPVPCSLTGYPTLGAAASSGTPLPAATSDSATLDGPATFGTTIPPGPVVLAHAARASFVLSFATTCDHVLAPGVPASGAPNECYAGTWLEVTPPQATTPILVTQPLRLTYATAGFQVGPFQVGSGAPLPGQPPPTIPKTVPTSPPTTAPPAPTTTVATTPPPAAPGTPPASP